VPVTLKRVSTFLVIASQSYAIPCRTLFSAESGRRRRRRRRQRRQDLSNVMPERDAAGACCSEMQERHTDFSDLFSRLL
jgi:hypothetical protein